MAKTISQLTDKLSPNRAIYALAIENLNDAGVDTERFTLDRVTGTNVVIVNSEDDFPAAVAGVRTLAANTTYVLGGFIETADTLKIDSESSLEGWGARTSRLTYTGVGNQFEIEDSSFSIIECSLDSGTGTMFSANSTGLANSFVTINNVRGVGGASLGTFEDISWNSRDAAFLFDDGLSFIGTNLFFIASNTSFVDDSEVTSVALDLGTATFSTFNFIRGTFAGAGTGISGTASSANMVAGAIADLTDVNFANMNTPLTNIDESDIRWFFTRCRGLEDSVYAAEAALTTAETVTVSATSTFYIVNGSNWTGDTEERFTVSSGGELTYNGENDQRFLILMRATIEKVGGGADFLKQRIGIDDGGGYVTYQKTEGGTDNTSPTTVVSDGIFTLQEGDKVATFVANDDSTADIIVNLCNVTIVSLT